MTALWLFRSSMYVCQTHELRQALLRSEGWLSESLHRSASQRRARLRTPATFPADGGHHHHQESPAGVSDLLPPVSSSVILLVVCCDTLSLSLPPSPSLPLSPSLALSPALTS